MQSLASFIDTQADLFVPGPTPLLLQRNYCSSDTFPGYSICGWSLPEPTQLQLNGSAFSSKKNNYTAVATTAHGARAKYSQTAVKKFKGELEFELGDNKGYTNCGTGLISGKTNLRNNRFVLNKNGKKDIKYTTGELHSGDSQKRKYVFRNVSLSGIAYFDLAYDERPNNTRTTFIYDKDDDGYHDIFHICNKNWAGNLDFGSLHFDWSKKVWKRKSSRLDLAWGTQLPIPS